MLKFTPCDDKWGWSLVTGFWSLVAGCRSQVRSFQEPSAKR